MSDFDDIDALAAEYALGTLDPAERADAEARRQREPELDAAIAAWERRLAPLAETLAPIEAPAGLLDKIEGRIFQTAGPGAEVIELRRRLNRWRVAALSTGALAACLAIGFGVWSTTRPSAGNYVAILQKDAVSPAFLISVNMDTRVVTVRPVAAPAEPGHSYELWLVNARLGAPRSLGVLDERAVSIHQASSVDRATVEDATYAVSLEPEGGSKTGAPSGPVLFTGKLISSQL